MRLIVDIRFLANKLKPLPDVTDLQAYQIGNDIESIARGRQINRGEFSFTKLIGFADREVCTTGADILAFSTQGAAHFIGQQGRKLVLAF